MSSEVAELDRPAACPPENWDEIAVADVVAMLPGFAFKSENFVTDTDAGLPLIRIRDLGLDTTATRYVGTYDEAFAVQDGDILVGMDGTFEAVRWQGGKALLNQRVLKLSPTRPDAIDEGYLFYRVQPALSELEQTISGTTVKHLSTKDLKRLTWKLPPLDEQRRIAEVLRSVDEAIAANRSALNQARLLQFCLAEDFLAKHSHGAETKLRDAVAETGSGWSPSCDPEAAQPEEWGILKTSAITWDGYDDGECKKLPDNLEPRPDLAVRAKDILITRAGQAYRTGVVSFVYATSGTRMISDKMIRIRADETKILPLVLCQILKGSSVQGQLNPLKSGLTTLTNITQKMIGDVYFPLPPMAEQRLFMQAVESVDEQIGTLVHEAKALSSLKSALVSDLLSGRVRVPA